MDCQGSYVLFYGTVMHDLLITGFFTFIVHDSVVVVGRLWLHPSENLSGISTTTSLER